MTQKYACVARRANTYPITLMCRVLGLARSGYYAWKKCPTSTHAHADVTRTSKIHQVFRDSRHTYGSPRVHAVVRQQGIRWSKERAACIDARGANRGVAATRRYAHT